MAGTLTIDTLKASSGVLATQNGMTGIAKAWVNFDGTTATIRGAFNVGSITKNATGLYTVNFTTAMPNVNYSVNVTASNPYNSVAGEMIGLVQAPNSASSVQIRNATTGASYDTSIACVSVFSA